MNELLLAAAYFGGGSGGGLIQLLVSLVVAGLIFWLVIWFVAWCGIPEPFAKIIKVIIGLVVLIFVIDVLLGLGGHNFIRW